MYYDLSLPANNSLQLMHIIQKLNQSNYCTAAVDYTFADTTVTPPPETFLNIKNNSKTANILSRATLIIDQTATLHQLSQTQNNGYDIMAIRPKNEKIFHALCVQYDNYDIISLDMGAKLPFMLKRNPVYEALRKGKYFQLQYSSMFEDASRVVCMTNMINLIKATGGKNLIMSSNASSIFTHRTPYDAAALLLSLGIPKNLALMTLKQNPQILLKSAIHRKFFKGAIKELSTANVIKLGKKIHKHRQRLRGLKEQKWAKVD